MLKNKFLILNHNNEGFFMDTTQGVKKNILFKFDKFQSTSQGDKG